MRHLLLLCLLCGCEYRDSAEQSQTEEWLDQQIQTLERLAYLKGINCGLKLSLRDVDECNEYSEPQP